MKTVAVIPALNENDRLHEVVRRTLEYVNEVVVVDDGSHQPLRHSLSHSDRLHVVRHAINLGKGAALTTGVEWAIRHGFQAAVFLDGDGQHDPSEIPMLLAPIQERRADIVFGVRALHYRMPFVARIGNIFLTTVIRLMFRINISDTQSGFRAIDLGTYDKLRWDSARYAVETEMIVNAGKRHLRHVQVPITTIYHDKYRGTTVLDGIRIFLNMISWRLQ